MRHLINICVNRPVAVIMALLSLFIAGGMSGFSMPLNKLPEVRPSRILVETAYSGMSAEEVRSLVTIPVEDALSPVKGLERISSISRTGASVITLDFRWGTNIQAAALLVREAVDMVYPNLPEGASKPLVITSALESEAHIIAAVHSKQNDAVFERRFADYELRARLRAVDGAGAIIVSGGKRGEAKIEFDIQKTASRGINPVQLSQIIGTQIQDIPAGSAREGDKEITVITKASIRSYNELAELVVAAPQPVKIKELARVSESEAPQESIFIVNGIEQTALEIYRRPGANPARLSADIKKEIKLINSAFERDISIEIIYDDAPQIISGIKNLCAAAFASALAVITVLFFFIRSVRLSFIAALSIVVSAAAALSSLALFGRTLNSMSLSGLALGLGIVSDTSVIIIDALERACPRKNEIAAQVSALSASSFGGAATTAVVFIPVIFLPGPLGALFGDLAIAIAASVVSGWIYAQFALPALFYIISKFDNPRRFSHRFALNRNTLNKNFYTAYKSAISWTLSNEKFVFAAAAFLSFLGAALVWTRPSSFITNDAAVEIIIGFQFPAGTRLETIADESEYLITKLNQLKFKNSYNCFEQVFARAGAEDEDASRRAQSSYQKEKLTARCVINKKIKPEDALKTANEFIETYSLHSKFGVKTFAVYPEDKTALLLGLSGENTYSVRAANPEEARRKAEQAEKLLRQSGAYLTLNIEPSGRRDEYRIYPRRETAAMLGVDAVNIARQSAQLTEGFLAGKIENPAHPIDIRVTGYDYNQKNGAQKRWTGGGRGIENIPLALTQNGLITLGAAGNVTRESSELSLARLDRGDTLYISGETISHGITLPETQLQNVIPEFSLFGESAFKRYKKSLIVILSLVLVLLYLTLGAQFESFLLPLVFLMSVPFALAGIGPALFVSGTRLDSGCAIALVALFGLVVNNGIILYETSAAKTHAGTEPREAVIEGACERLRPVLATTITTVIVLLPLAFTPLGAAQKSMSITMLGGCLASTALTLFAMPCVFLRYLCVCRRRTQITPANHTAIINPE